MRPSYFAALLLPALLSLSAPANSESENKNKGHDASMMTRAEASSVPLIEIDLKIDQIESVVQALLREQDRAVDRNTANALKAPKTELRQITAGLNERITDWRRKNAETGLQDTDEEFEEMNRLRDRAREGTSCIVLMSNSSATGDFLINIVDDAGNSNPFFAGCVQAFDDGSVPKE
ncbi:MAG: hypothetical protein AAGF33_18410 [Pseudomonadota bacterium]